jgi:hypothetical protein
MTREKLRWESKEKGAEKKKKKIHKINRRQQRGRVK